MNRTMITATNTLAQLQKQMDIISNNLANIDTAGYKRREATFTDLLFQEYRNQTNVNEEQNRLTPAGIRQGTGARLSQSQIIMKQGNLKTTGRQLDVAFTKEGQYFRVLVQNEDGSSIHLTRGGSFHLTPISENEMMLVTGDGYSILDENNNPISITGDAKGYTITENGQLVVEKTNGTRQVVNLGVTLVKKPQFLEQKGANLLGLPENFAELGVLEEDILTQLNGPLRAQISMKQGVLEQSNVDLSKEMTELMNVQRSYQFQSRSITIADQMMGLVNGIR